VLIEDKPVLFDAIEFDDRIATGDVLYDLAFLLMDLIERGLRPAANIVFNRYLIETQRVHDLDALAALPLFMSVRAVIRAKVTAARRKHSDARVKLSRDARSYADLARELLQAAKPKLVAIGGLSGTGKSLLARTLASEIMPMPGAVVLRSDIERKVMFGVAEAETLPKSAYTAEATAKVYATRGASSRQGIRQSLTPCLRSPASAQTSRKRRIPSIFPVFFSPPTCTHGLSGSARGQAMRPTQTRPSCRIRKSSSWATSTGRESMRPAPRKKSSFVPE
jgi:predicted kinase